MPPVLVRTEREAMVRLRVAVPLVLGALAVVIVFPGSAAARERPAGVFVPGVVEPPPLGLAMSDRVLVKGKGGIGGLEPAAVDRRRIRTPDGLAVIVKTSPRYIPDVKYDERLVAFLDSLLHGAELNGLRVYVAPPKEMVSVCGGQSAACYDGRGNTMYIVGEASFAGIPISYVVAHEYGHRIEDYRNNSPFYGGAFFWGTKRWASVTQVCEGFDRGLYFPGDEGRHYFENPGEAFAESYAWSQVGRPLGGWRWIGSLRPTEEAFAAIRADVVRPWRPVRSRKQGTLTGERPQRVFHLRPKYDGFIQIRSSGGGDLDLEISDREGHVLRSARRGTSRERVLGTLCGDRRFRLVVRASRFPARYKLEIETP
jgi:hypothetical protein